ncbi:MAG: hypothetical protein R3304_09295 [Longimicrobiales bacterium]|nr:hypothetical protein [Longimicrobiales bacterium]
MTRRSYALITTALLPLMLACGRSGPADPLDEPESLYNESPCVGLDLAATSGMPLAEVTLGSLPSGFSSPFAAALNAEDGEPDAFAYVRPDSAGRLYLTVPIHPDEPVDGGSVSLTFTDGTQACPAVDFTILAMPPAEGELAAAVEGLQQVIAAQAALFGGTSEELRATPIDSVPPSLWPAALVQTLLDDPDNDESLLAVANGAMGEDALRWVNGLTALTGLRQALEAAPSAAPSPSQLAPRPSDPARLDAQIDLLCSADYIATDEKLNECMELASSMAASTTGLSREVADDIQSAFAELASHNLPLAGELQTIFAAMFWIIYTERELTASVLPSRFVDAEAAAHPERMPEDDDSYGQVDLSVRAASIGYDMQAHILDGIAQAKALVDLTGKFDFSTGTKLDEVAEKLAPKIESRIRDADIEGLQIPAEVAHVTVDNPDLIDYRILSGDAVERVDSRNFQGKKWGPATLSVRTADGAFGGSQIADQVDVEVVPIQIVIDPAEVLLQASEFAILRVEVKNAKYPGSVRLFQPEELQGEATLDKGDGNVHFVSYTAPPTPNPSESDLVVVEHFARVGARYSGEPPRRGTATIRFDGKVVITPEPPCLDLNEEVTFSAAVEGPVNQEVRWSAVEGTIDQDGTYTAPPSRPASGLDTIRATSVEVESLVGELVVAVGCSCNFLLRLGSDVITAQPGDELNFTTGFERELLSVGANRPSRDWDVTMIPFDDTDPSTWPDAPGTWSMNVQGDMGLTAPDVYWATGEEPANLELETFEPFVEVRGEVSGIAGVISNPSYEVSFDWWFSIQTPSGEFSCTVPDAGE